MTPLAVTTVDLARVAVRDDVDLPLPLRAAHARAWRRWWRSCRRAWYRTGVDAWLRLTKFFGTLLLINFAIGVATGLVQEFQFGMNWSVYSEFVGGVFGAPLAIEGLAAFVARGDVHRAVDLRLGPAVAARAPGDDLARRAAGTWMSAYFILVANSWMQHPVGYKMVDGEAQLTNVWALLSNEFALIAWVHTILAGLIFGTMVVLGVSCWHILRGRNVELFRRARGAGARSSPCRRR